MIRRVTLGIGFMALATPVVYLYVLLAAPGPATAVAAVIPLTPTSVLVAVAAFLFGWVTIATLSFPHSLDAPPPPAEAGSWAGGKVPETSNNDGGIPIMRRHVRVRWAESANPAA